MSTAVAVPRFGRPLAIGARLLGVALLTALTGYLAVSYVIGEQFSGAERHHIERGPQLTGTSTYEDVALRTNDEAIERIERHTRARRAAFADQDLVQVWVIDNLDVVGEATRGVSDDLKRRRPDVQWREVVAMRNVLGARLLRDRCRARLGDRREEPSEAQGADSRDRRGDVRRG